MWLWMLEKKVDLGLIVDGRGYLTTPLLIQKAPAWRPRRWPPTRTVGRCIRGISGSSEGLYDIDTRQYARGVTSNDAPGVKLSDGLAKLRELVHLPRNWPLARLTIPLGGLSKQVDRLLEGYCFQILGTNRDPDAHNGNNPDSHTFDLDSG